MVQVSASILSADFGRLKEEVESVEAAGADRIHIDVMDGHFVPNITMGPLVVSAVRKCTKLPLDVHLMISNPERYVSDFAKAGADSIGVHVEATFHIERLLMQIRELGKKATITLNPATHESVLEHIVHAFDAVLVMSVNPGFAAQKFMDSAVGKISRIKALLSAAGRQRDCPIEIDGGITAATAPRVIAAGADVLIAGSAIFGSADYKAAIASLKGH
jgi:ribulose-phosphate 3-epimerase